VFILTALIINVLIEDKFEQLLINYDIYDLVLC